MMKLDSNRSLESSVLPYANLADVVFSRAKLRPDATAYRQLPAKSLFATPKESSYYELTQTANSIAGYLEKHGVEPGARVALISNNRPEWMESHLGIMRAGGVLVPCYTSDPISRLAYVIRDAGVEFAFVENQEQAEKLLQALEAGINIPEVEGRPAHTTKPHNLKKIISFEQLSSELANNDLFDCYKDVLDQKCSVDDLEKIRTLAGLNSESTIIYTSGSTGTPKGVIAKQVNHIANIMQIEASGIVDDVHSAYQLLPLSHGFGLQILHALNYIGGTAIFPRITDPKSSALTDAARKVLIEDMARGNPEIIPIVPRVLKSLIMGIEEKAKSGSVLSPLLSVTLKSYLAAFRSAENGGVVDIDTQRIIATLENPLLASVGPKLKAMIARKIVGKNFKYFVSGGAPLSQDLYDKFWSLDLPIYNGYGSTEANVPVSVNTPSANKRGSVGKVFPGIEAKVTEDGELMFRGANVAAGYNNRPLAQEKAFDADGWLHTNDIGSIDEDGYVFIGRRADDLIVMSNGKNIEPGPLEDILRTHSDVVDTAVVGHGRSQLVALVVLDDKKFAASSVERDQLGKEILENANSQIEKAGEKIKGIIFIKVPKMGQGLSNKYTLQKWKLEELYANEIEQICNAQEKDEVIRFWDSYPPESNSSTEEKL